MSTILRTYYEMQTPPPVSATAAACLGHRRRSVSATAAALSRRAAAAPLTSYLLESPGKTRQEKRLDRSLLGTRYCEDTAALYYKDAALSLRTAAAPLTSYLLESLDKTNKSGCSSPLGTKNCVSPPRGKRETECTSKARDFLLPFSRVRCIEGVT